jgi:hypothetical protein
MAGSLLVSPSHGGLRASHLLTPGGILPLDLQSGRKAR